VLPDTISSALGFKDGRGDEKTESGITAESSSETDFVEFWRKGISVFGNPVMNPPQLNSVIENFVEQIERVEQEIGRNTVTEVEIAEIEKEERIHSVEIRDEDGEFLQEYIDHYNEKYGEFVGDRYIARAGYQIWNDDVSVERMIEGYDETENLPVPTNSLRNKVWLEVQSPRNAPESEYLREIIEVFSQYETFTEYAQDQDLPELE